MNICFHTFAKMEKKPHHTYIDYSGYRVGVFKCYCTKCGLVRNRKFY